MSRQQKRTPNILEEFIDSLSEINETLNKTIDQLTNVVEKQQKILLTGTL